MTPSKITVLIEGEEELEAKLVSFSETYQASLYEVSDGRSFYVDPELIKESVESHKPVPIPLEVITTRQKMLAKLSWAQDQLNRLHREQTSNLILPDAISV